MFGRRKYNRGHPVKGQWVFGGVERESGKTFLGLQCRIGTPIFLSPTQVSLQSVLQVLLQVFRIPFIHVSVFSMIDRTQNATSILLQNTHPLGQLQIERQIGSRFFLCSIQLWYSCVPFCIKMLAHINTLVTVYEERVRRMQKVLRFSHGMDPLYSDHL